MLVIDGLSIKTIRDLVFNHILQLNLTLQRHGISFPFEERLRQRWNTSFLSQILAFNGLEDEEPQDLILEGGGNSTENPERIIAHRFNSPGSRPSRTTDFDDILPFVADFVEEISSPRNHRILNSHTDDIVDYDAEPSLKAIIHEDITSKRFDFQRISSRIYVEGVIQTCQV